MCSEKISDAHEIPMWSRLYQKSLLMRRYYRHVPLFLLQLELMERLVEVQLSRVPHALDCFILTPVVHRDPYLWWSYLFRLLFSHPLVTAHLDLFFFQNGYNVRYPFRRLHVVLER